MGQILFAAIACAALACDDKPAGSKPPAVEKKPFLTPKQIAEDKTLTDEQAIKAYADHPKYKPTMMPKGQTEWAVVQPFKGGGHLLFVKKLDPVQLGSYSDKTDPMQAERDGLKQAAEFCHAVLTDLQPRGLKGISFTFQSGVKGEAGFTDMFRVLVTPENLPKIAAVKDGPAVTGSVFDPRGEACKSIWAVDVNVYPEIVYSKRGAK